MAKVYALTNPVTAEIRYIGRTVRSLRERWRDHRVMSFTKESPYHVHCWWRSMVDQYDEHPEIVLVEGDIDREDVDEREVWWISEFRDVGFDLTNHTDGGDSPPESFVNGDFTEETRRKLAKTSRETWQDPEIREKRLQGIREYAENNHHFSEGFPEDMKKKKSENMKKKWEDPDFRQRMLEKLAEGRDEEWREKIRESLYGQRRAAKITMEDAEEIRSRYEDGETQTKIAKDYPISHAAVSDIVNYKTWVPEELGEDEIEELIPEQYKTQKNYGKE